jgi:hypothetical protein
MLLPKPACGGTPHRTMSARHGQTATGDNSRVVLDNEGSDDGSRSSACVSSMVATTF